MVSLMPQMNNALKEAVSVVQNMTPEDIEICDEYDRTMYAIGQRFYLANQYEMALNVFKLPLMTNPLNAQCLRGCAFSCKHLNQSEEAMTYFNQLIRLQHAQGIQDPAPFVAMVEIFITRKDLKRAAQYLDMADKVLAQGVDGNNQPLSESEKTSIKKRIELLQKTVHKQG